MISEVDRYQGVVFRQLLVARGARMQLGVADLAGRVDAFSVEGAAFQVKHCSKRLSPWQFTYLPENLDELDKLAVGFSPVWVILVCGSDGVVCLSLEELKSIVKLGDGGAAWVRVRRTRKAMYRVSGVLGELARAKPRGVAPFIAAVFRERAVEVTE